MCNKQRNILYVEDHEDSRLLMSFVLQRAGFQVTAVASLADAQNLSSRPFDLYLLDRGLGDGLSLSLCEQLRATYPTAPVVFCTGSSDWEDKQAALQAGANAYLTKPYEINELVQTLRNLLPC